MPLLDHFHPPLAPVRHWESFHALWAGSIGERLNLHLLPKGYFAETQVHIGNRIEVGVASFESAEVPHQESQSGNGGVAVATWAPPAAALTMPAIFPDEV